MNRSEPGISLDAVDWVGRGLNRPECVLATSSGDLYTSDWRGGVARLDARGGAELFSAMRKDGRTPRPNGFALRANGNFLLAELGETEGGVYELTRGGQLTAFLKRVDGVDLPPTNFVHEDARGRTWVTVSTRHAPRAAAYRSDVADGFIVLVDKAGARVAADGLGYTNEALPSPDGAHLYVNETFGRRLSRFRIGANGDLRLRETVCEFGHGTYPDGLAFDAAGGVWVVSIISNRVIRVAPDGSQELMLEDADAKHVEWCEQAFLAGQLGREHLDRAAGRRLKNISSLAFGGPDLHTAYLGCLLGDRLACFRAPVAGHPPAHWRWGAG
jgi:sugar lactone lactonase YvrE